MIKNSDYWQEKLNLTANFLKHKNESLLPILWKSKKCPSEKRPETHGFSMSKCKFHIKKSPWDPRMSKVHQNSYYRCTTYFIWSVQYSCSLNQCNLDDSFMHTANETTEKYHQFPWKNLYKKLGKRSNKQTKLILIKTWLGNVVI